MCVCACVRVCVCMSGNHSVIDKQDVQKETTNIPWPQFEVTILVCSLIDVNINGALLRLPHIKHNMLLAVLQ